MTDLIRNGDHEDDALEPSGWLREALTEAAVSPGMRERARRAADLGYAVCRLRRQRAKHGVLKEGFSTYVTALARGAGVSLDDLVAWFRIPGFTPESPGYGASVALFGKELGMEPRELRASGLAGFVEALGLNAGAFSAARGDGLRAVPALDEWEAELREAEEQLTPEQREVWLRIEREIRAAFGR